GDARRARRRSGRRCPGTGNHHERDGDDITKRKPRPEEEKSGRGSYGRLEAHQDSEELSGQATQRRELEREGNGRRQDGDSETDAEVADVEKATSGAHDA